MKYFLFLILGVVFTWPAFVQAAPPVPSITFDVPAEIHGVGDIVPVTVRLSTDGLNLNALDLTINYSTIGLAIVRVEPARSNWPLWPEEPAVDNARGYLHLSAGRPNGLIAVGASVATIYVRLQASGLWQFRLADISRGFLNDGQGSPTVLQSSPVDMPVVELVPFGIELSSPTHPSPTTWYSASTIEVSWKLVPDLKYSLAFSSDPAVTPDANPDTTTGTEHWTQVDDGIWWFTIKAFSPDGGWSRVSRRAFQIDTTAPEPFTITQLPPNQVGGQTVIAWSAHDAGSGLAAYQLALNGQASGAVSSPLHVRKEWAGKTLTLRAVDGAGNAVSVSWHDDRQSFPWTMLWIIVAVIGGAGLIAIFSLRRPRRG